jgi:hypothetical protein
MQKTHSSEAVEADICKVCKLPILPVARARISDTCITCGAHHAKSVKFTIVPMHKSNYTVVTDRDTLKQLNKKGV